MSSLEDAKEANPSGIYFTKDVKDKRPSQRADAAHGEQEYLVSWWGYESGDDTWEPEGSVPPQLKQVWVDRCATESQHAAGTKAVAEPRFLKKQKPAPQPKAAKSAAQSKNLSRPARNGITKAQQDDTADNVEEELQLAIAASKQQVSANLPILPLDLAVKARRVGRSSIVSITFAVSAGPHRPKGTP